MKNRTSISVGQINKIVDFVRQAIKDLALGFRQVQAFINDPIRVAEFKEGFKALLTKVIQVNPFAEERVKQGRFYPKGWKPATIEEQKALLAKLFKRIDLSQVDELTAKAKVLKLADGLAVIPKLAYLGGVWGIADPYGKGYGPICEKLFELIAPSYSFNNLHSRDIDAEHIRIMRDVRKRLKKLEAETPGDVLVLAFDFGNLYAGRSPRNTRWEALNRNQLPLVTAQVGCLLLIMPDRLTAYEQLSINCSGDEWDWSAVDSWTSCPYFSFYDGKLQFSAGYANDPHGCFGSAVAFLGV